MNQQMVVPCHSSHSMMRMMSIHGTMSLTETGLRRNDCLNKSWISYWSNGWMVNLYDSIILTSGTIDPGSGIGGSGTC